MKQAIKKLGQFLQAALLLVVVLIFKVLSIDTASALGGQDCAGMRAFPARTPRSGQ